MAQADFELTAPLLQRPSTTSSNPRSFRRPYCSLTRPAASSLVSSTVNWPHQVSGAKCQEPWPTTKPHTRAQLQGRTWLLTIHLSTWAAPALVSSASRGPSSPFLVADRSFSEYRWRSSVRCPGTTSKESKSLQKMRGCRRAWEQSFDMTHGRTQVLTRQGRITGLVTS